MGKIILAVTFAVTTAAKPEQRSPHEGHGAHEGMAMDARAIASDSQAKLLADKKESEFNHHLAGLFVALGAVFMLFQDRLKARWPAVKHLWPACFLISGIFVLVWSDTELWPFGRQPWIDAMIDSSEVLQHKTFAVLLLTLGIIEWQRARGVLTSAWSGWVFPVLAIGGSVLLLFHSHGAGMHGADHLERMARIQSEHLSYSLAGIGVALTRTLSEIETHWRKVFSKTWPALMIVLGILLMLYRE
jgi:copper resistance protein D